MLRCPLVFIPTAVLLALVAYGNGNDDDDIVPTSTTMLSQRPTGAERLNAR